MLASESDAYPSQGRKNLYFSQQKLAALHSAGGLLHTQFFPNYFLLLWSQLLTKQLSMDWEFWLQYLFG